MSEPAASPADAAARPPGLYAQIRDLDDRFWIVNVMEMFERLAYYGVRTVVPLYMVLATEQGGPEFTHVQKGNIFAAWAAVQSVLPAFTGGFADRYGHKKTIAAAILLKIVGYVMMAEFTSYLPFLLGCMMLAAGTAIFKPAVQGTLAASMTPQNASVGWGIFYQIVNVGGFLGPVLAGVLRLMDWSFVFYSCAVIVSINFLWLPFYTDPTQEKAANETSTEADARHRDGWAVLSQSVTALTAWTWSAIFGLGAAAWYALLFGVGYAAAESAPLLWPLLAFTGAALGLPTLLSAGRNARSWVLLTGLFAVTLTLIVGGQHREAMDALTTLPGGSTLAGLAFAGLYLVPTVTALGAVLTWFAARKDWYDQGQDNPFDVFVVSVTGLFQHRVLWFALVFSGFWLMFNQVFDLLPNVIDDWVDSSGMIAAMGSAFSTPLVPTTLAVVLGILYGALCAVGVLLAMRPDRRALADVSVPAYAVVAMALAGAAYFPAMLAVGPARALIASAVIGPLASAIARLARLPALPLAGGALAAGALGAILVGRSSLLEAAPSLVALAEAGAQVNPEWMINLNPGLIVFTMVFFAYLSSFVRPLTSIIVGMVVATAGSLLAGTAVLGWVCLAGILVFSIGEMLSSPKKMEYLATLARKGQEGLFMGYANIPIAIGWISGSIFAGSRYELHGDKTNLARRHLIETVGLPEQVVADLPKSDVMPTLAAHVGGTVREAQAMLFHTYHPEYLWFQIAGIGLVSIVGMLVYDRVLRRIDATTRASA